VTTYGSTEALPFKITGTLAGTVYGGMQIGVYPKEGSLAIYAAGSTEKTEISVKGLAWLGLDSYSVPTVPSAEAEPSDPDSSARLFAAMGTASAAAVAMASLF
jgi:hypothetical protein